MIFKIFAGYHPSSYPEYAWQTKNISERSHLTELCANRDEQISNQWPFFPMNAWQVSIQSAFLHQPGCFIPQTTYQGVNRLFIFEGFSSNANLSWPIVILQDFRHKNSRLSRWWRWFQIFFIFTLAWGDDPIWLTFFRWVKTTNHLCTLFRAPCHISWPLLSYSVIWWCGAFHSVI